MKHKGSPKAYVEFLTVDFSHLQTWQFHMVQPDTKWKYEQQVNDFN